MHCQYGHPQTANWARVVGPPKTVTVLLFSLNSDHEKRNQILFGTAQQDYILPCVFLWFPCIRSQWLHGRQQRNQAHNSDFFLWHTHDHTWWVYMIVHISLQIWNLTSFTMISNEFHNSAFGSHCSLTQLLTIAKSPQHEQSNFWGLFPELHTPHTGWQTK
jgi:hypothetical protein